MIYTILAIFRKDLAIELRTRYALNTLLAFTGAALLTILFALQADTLDPAPRSGLVWIVILFAAMAGMSRTFVAESEQKTWPLLRLYGGATEVYTGKLLYNFLFLLTLNLFTFLLYSIMMGSVIVHHSLLAGTIFLGALGIASITTLTSAIISRADRRGPLFSVLSIPLLVPLLLILTRTTRIAWTGEEDPTTLEDLTALVAYCGATITAGVLLFDYIWDE
ncbi:MAG: heme exporter protein CcmB [Balneolaceae bacterium]